MTFSIDAVKIVERNKGFVLYAGGDDIICILPAENALTAAFEIRAAYRGTQGLEGFYNIKSDSYTTTATTGAFILSMGGLGQTFSLVYSHHKYPLSYAIDKLNNEEKNAKEQEWNSISKNNIAITYLARGSHDTTVYLPLQREGLKLGSVCKEIDDLLIDINEGRYSGSIISDFLNWKEKIRYIEYDDDDENIILQLIKYVISRNIITKNQKPDYEKLADRISKLAKIKNNRIELGNAATRERDKLKNKSLIEDFFVALKASNSARREIE
jgi:CRISPR-associated protein Cmr2